MIFFKKEFFKGSIKENAKMTLLVHGGEHAFCAKADALLMVPRGTVEYESQKDFEMHEKTLFFFFLACTSYCKT